MEQFTLAQLAELEKNHPEQYWELVAFTATQMTRDEANERYLDELAKTARSGDTLEAFAAFYEGVHGGKMLPHLLAVERESFEAWTKGDIWLLLGFRGSRKTSTDSVTKKAWLHGLFPSKTGIITGANDPNAKLIAKSIAQIIELHPFFKRAFPYVAVDKPRGWGAEGYWVRDTRMSEADWVSQQAKVNDPSFVGGGYKSSEINGKHPTLYLDVDDLHDIDSSSSVTEREAIKSVFNFQILPTVPRAADRFVARVELKGVPFAKDDTYAELRKAGGVTYTEMPVMRRAAENAEGAVYCDGKNEATGAVYDDIVGWWYLTAPELFGVKSIVETRSKGKGVFWQMFMLDINIAKTQGLKYYLYSHKDIGFDLPTVGGVDPSGIDPDTEVGGKKRSSFALCYLSKLAMGGAVVKDGVLKPLGMEKAKLAIIQAQSMFANWQTTGVEDVSVGKMFLQYLFTDSRVNATPSSIYNPKYKGVQDKLTRFNLEVAPWLESGVIRISDENTTYLEALRYGLDNFFDLDPKKPHEALDAMDSLYHAAKMIPEILRTLATDDISPQGRRLKQGMWHPYFGKQPAGAVHGR